jgi:hypothetical protein
MDDPCSCSGPGYCASRGREVSKIGYRICRRGDARSVEAYFRERRDEMTTASKGSASTSCAYLGLALLDGTGNQAVRACQTCRGNVRLKVFVCGHPGHAGDPTTTLKACVTCRDFSPHPATSRTRS